MNNPPFRMASTAGARFGFSRQDRAQEKTSAENPAQPIDKSRFERENPRKSKEIQSPKQGFRAEMGRPQENPNGSMPSDKGFSAPSGIRLLAADPDVVLRVAGGIVGIAGGIVCAEVRLSGGIDRLIGAAAGERERHKSQKDRDPHSHPPAQWRPGRRTRERGVLGDQVQECKTRRLPQLGGGLRRDRPDLRRWRLRRRLRQAGIRKNLQFVAKKRTAC
jgi:hypothetical protein